MLFRSWFKPAGPTVGDWNPDDFPKEDVEIRTPDGLRLHGWYVEHARPSAVILICHGSGGNLALEGGVLEKLYKVVGASVLIFDYRGYGKSEGAVESEAGFLADARAADEWLAKRAGVPASEVVLIGRSLGTAVAVDLASTLGARALVLESGFPSLAAISAHHYWWAPIQRWTRFRFDSMSKIDEYRGPLLLSHSDADRVAPLQLVQQLYDRAPGPKEMLLFHGLTHFDAEPPEFYDALRDFLARHPAAGASRSP